MAQEEKPDAFTPEVVKFEVGGEKFEIKALPLKKFKEALAIVKKALALVQTAALENDLAILDQIPDIAMGEFLKLAPVVFQRPDLTADWWESHFSLPLAKKALEEASRVNGVMDFLGQTRWAKPAEEPKTPGSAPSTTLSPSPTAGPTKQ